MKSGILLATWMLLFLVTWAAITLLYIVFHIFLPIKGQDLSWQGAVFEAFHEVWPWMVGWLLAMCIPFVRRRILGEVQAELDKCKKDDGKKAVEQDKTRSPFDVEGVKTPITREEIIEAIHDGRGNDRW